MKKFVNLQGELGDLTIGQVKIENQHLIAEIGVEEKEEISGIQEFISGLNVIVKDYENDPFTRNLKIKKLELKTGFCEGLLLRNDILTRHFNMPFM